MLELLVLLLDGKTYTQTASAWCIVYVHLTGLQHGNNSVQLESVNQHSLGMSGAPKEQKKGRSSFV